MNIARNLGGSNRTSSTQNRKKPSKQDIEVLKRLIPKYSISKTNILKHHPLEYFIRKKYNAPGEGTNYVNRHGNKRTNATNSPGVRIESIRRRWNQRL